MQNNTSTQTSFSQIVCPYWLNDHAPLFMIISFTPIASILTQRLFNTTLRVMNFTGESAAILAALGWTISAVCFTTASKQVGSMVVNTVKLAISLPFFLLYGQVFLGEAIPSAAPQEWFMLSISGILGFFICDLCLFRSFLLIGPRLGMLILSLSPIASSICGYYWLGETLRMLDIAGIAIALSGVTWVMLESPKKIKHLPHGRKLWMGLTFALIAMITQGVSSVFSKVGMQGGVSPVAANEIRLIAGLFCFLILMPAIGKRRQCIAAFKVPKTMAIMTAGSLAGPTFGVAFLMYAITKIPTGLAMTFISLTPVMIIPFMIIIYKEKVSWRAFLGAVVACAGVALLLL